MKKVRLHLFVLVGFAAVMCTTLPGLFNNAISDWRFSQITRPSTGKVVLVAIDPRSIESVGVWPWPRRLHAQLIDKLQAAGATDIAFDVDFSSASTPEGDAAFAAALAGAGGSVILPSFSQRGRGKDADHVHINQPLRQFQDSSWQALVNVTPDADSRVRHYPLGETLAAQFLPSMAALLAGRLDHSTSNFAIDYGIDAASVPVISYIDVLNDDAAALAAIRDKKVIVGGTAIELGDRFSVPRYRVLSGPMLQVLAAESLLQNRSIRSTSWVASLIWVAALALLMLLIWKRWSAGRRVLFLAGLAAGCEAVALLVQARSPVLLDTSPVLIIIALYALACALDEIDLRGLMRAVAERRFRSIAMSIGDGLVCVDDSRTITFWNPAAAAIFGIPASDLIGQSIERLFNGDALFSVSETLSPEALLSATARTIEVDAVRKSGEVFPLEMCISSWKGADGTQYGAVLRDITERRREEQRIRYLAEFDTITGLANRNALLARLRDLIGRRAEGAALICIAIDNLAQIVDLWGAEQGDAVLRAFTTRLGYVAGGTELIAHLGNGEFAVIIRGNAAAGSDEAMAAQWTALENEPLRLAGREQKISLSFGAIRIHDQHRSADEVFAAAHLALYRAKSLLAHRFVLYSEQIREEIESRAALEIELKRAIMAGEFELFYQPQHRLSDGKLVGAEALIRWRHRERGLVPPFSFMPVVHSSSLAREVADWVLATACAQARRWELAGHCLRIAVNLSPVQFVGSDLAEQVSHILAAEQLAPALLELELTEDILVEDMAAVVKIVSAIRAQGVRVVFDDFGTGFASLSYLRGLPVDGLKLDRTFVSGMRTSSADTSIVGSMISLGGQLEMTVIAEGIEDGATAELLRRMGCEEGQGYYFGKPLPVSDFEQLPGMADAAALSDQAG